jgi:ubiquitin-protein ligase
MPLQKELKEIDSDKASGVTAEVVDDNLQHLIGSVPGPKDTPYEGGVFRVDIQLDAQYPFAPPKMRFITRVWHPNVSSQNGAICLGEQQQFVVEAKHKCVQQVWLGAVVEKLIKPAQGQPFRRGLVLRWLQRVLAWAMGSVDKD